MVQAAPPPVTYQQPMVTTPVVQQQAPPARGGRRSRGGRGRRGRGGGVPRSVPQVSGSGLLIYQDTEFLTPTANLGVYEFNPSCDGLVRLAQHEKMYTRYRVINFNITWKPATSAMTNGAVYFGILPGVKNANVKDKTTILQVRPSRMTPVWKSATITTGSSIDTQRYMKCGAGGDDVSFTLYVNTDASAWYGAFQVSYRVELSFPNPF